MNGVAASRKRQERNMDDNPSLFCIVSSTPKKYKKFKEWWCQQEVSGMKDTPTIREYRLIELHWSTQDTPVIRQRLRDVIFSDYVEGRFGTPRNIISWVLNKFGILEPVELPEKSARKARHKIGSVILFPLGYRGKQYLKKDFLR